MRGLYSYLSPGKIKFDEIRKMKIIYYKFKDNIQAINLVQPESSEDSASKYIILR